MRLLLLLILSGCASTHQTVPPNCKTNWTSIGTLTLFNGQVYDVLQPQLYIFKSTNFMDLRYQTMPAPPMPQMQRGSPPLEPNTIPTPPILPPQRTKE